MSTAELNQSAQLSQLEELADSSGALRRHVTSRDELYDLIAPATPDKLLLLDEAGSIFHAAWWTGNEDARQVASKDVAALLASPQVIPLSAYTDSPHENDHLGLSFYLTLPPELINEA